ncbi:ABC transporter, ATP-binding protein, partial [Teladorsagia circumcincta]
NVIDDEFRFFMYLVYYPLICLELLLSCFADTPSGTFIGKQICPELSTSFLNQITFQWFTGLAVKGYKRPLERDDLWALNERDRASHLIPQFNHYFKRQFPETQAEKKPKPTSLGPPASHPSILVPLFQTYKFSFISGALLKLTFDLLQFVAPALLRYLINFIQTNVLKNHDQPLWIGICIASTMFIVAVVQSMILHQYFHLMFRLGMNIRSVLTSAVYSKVSSLVIQVRNYAMNLSNNARKNRTTGEIVNLMSVDIQRLQDMTTFVMLFWSAPLQVILSIVFLWRILGVAVIAGLVILVAMVPINSYISVKMRNCQVQQMKYKDERLKMMSEVLNGIKVLKLYAWEKSMENAILNIRVKELNVLRRLAFLNAATTLSWACAPFLVLFAIIENATFAWENGDVEETLRNITMTVGRGQLVAIVGKVGAGKSSLLQAILGEMNKISGSVNVSGSVAYVPQQAWIQNLSLRNNILFNRTYDRVFYEKVLDACALRQDLASLPAEDMTEIGEKDMDAIDTTLPGSIRSMLMTVFNVIATLVVIVIATPLVAIPFVFLAVFYIVVLDMECLDYRLPGAILTFIGAAVQAMIIVAVPVYATPPIIFLLVPVFVFYFYILDVDCLDNAIPRSLMSFVRTLIASVEIIAVIIWSTPISAAALGPLFAIYFLFLVCLTKYYARFYVSTSRQLKRLESASRSPIYSHFQESIQGAASIRAYRLVDEFVKESERRVDENLATYYPSIVANRWLAVRLELVGNLIVMFSALFAVLFRDSPGLTAGLVGLSVSYALNITQTLNWAVRMTSELETNIVAVERIKEYSDSPVEGAHSKVKPADSWPQLGRIDIRNVCLRYRTGLEPVLKDVSVSIASKEKVGIVGRTGAGKSSLTLALFRTVEIDSGTIEIDGEDISKFSLEELRSRLTIVPQDPVLFSGTLRFNLDPFNAYTDAEIWNALRNAHLEPFVSSLAEKLQHQISEGGENLRQVPKYQLYRLLCLARALLRRPRILILDEAAAAVDAETDSLLQRTIREQFADCTVLTIAHRLHTVMDCDRLLVLSAGCVVEFDSPKALLAKPEGVFYSMAKDAGIV